MRITHEEAHKLIQLKSDQSLSSNNREILDTHLKDCDECSAYAHELQETEETLRAVMQKHWNSYPLLSYPSIIRVGVSSKDRISNLVTTRSALIGVTVLLFVFVLWQFASTSNGSAKPMIGVVSPIPTPSLLLTSTQNNFANCQRLQYETRQNDTLESIARQFSTSKEAIMKLNHLESETLHSSTRLIIPICDLTPTSTIYPPTFTTTPALELTTYYTPG